MAIFTLAALKSELVNDPASVGYATPRTQGDTQRLADLINAVGAGTTFRNDIAPKEVINAIAAADFAGLTAVKCAQLQLLLLAAPIDATLTNVRQRFADIFVAGTTLTALQAMAQRNCSRAETLWGTGTTITPEQVARALAS